MTAEQHRQQELRRQRRSPKLEFPAHCGEPEPLLMALRRGMHAIMGLSSHVLDHRLEGEQVSLMNRLQECVDAVNAQPPPLVLHLSEGARLLQEHFGAGSQYANNPHMQVQVRAICVAMTILERAGRRQYREEPAKAKKGR